MTAIIDPAIGRRAFCLSLGAGLTILSLPSIAGAADLKKVPMSTGIDAVFAPFVVASEKKIFEKYGLETNYKPFDDGNVALDAVLTGASDIGSTSELGGLARWDKGGKLYVTGMVMTSKEQLGITAVEGIKKPEDLIGKTVGYPKASAGHYYFGRYAKKYKLPVDQIKVKSCKRRRWLPRWSGRISTRFSCGSRGIPRPPRSSRAPMSSPARAMTGC